jgi:hypothetical protein
MRRRAVPSTASAERIYSPRGVSGVGVHPTAGPRRNSNVHVWPPRRALRHDHTFHRSPLGLRSLTAELAVISRRTGRSDRPRSDRPATRGDLEWRADGGVNPVPSGGRFTGPIGLRICCSASCDPEVFGPPPAQDDGRRRSSAWLKRVGAKIGNERKPNAIQATLRDDSACRNRCWGVHRPGHVERRLRRP